jgi:hypothetical protein
MYRLGGRETSPRYGGSFKTQREALARKQWIAGELAAMRVPDLHLLEPAAPASIRELAAAWQAARVDVSEGTKETYRVALGRLLPRLGELPAAELEPHHVAELVAELSEAGLRKQTIRKTVSVLAMIIDHHGLQPNAARDRRVKMPREEKRELTPPSAEHIEAVVRLLPTRYRLPARMLDATGCGSASSRRSPGATSTSRDSAGASRAPWRRQDGRGGSRFRPCSSRPSPGSWRGKTAFPSVSSSRGSAASASERQSPAPAPRPACRTSRRMTSAIAASRCFTSAGCRGPGSANSSATMT